MSICLKNGISPQRTRRTQRNSNAYARRCNHLGRNHLRRHHPMDNLLQLAKLLVFPLRSPRPLRFNCFLNEKYFPCSERS